MRATFLFIPVLFGGIGFGQTGETAPAANLDRARDILKKILRDKNRTARQGEV
jgi:hypothetical protein